MERKDFLKKSIGFLGLAVAAPSLISLSKKEEEIAVCTVTNSETAGPFPTISPASYVRSNIVTDNRTGVAFTINITINNTNGNCAAYQGALVDIWHCDKDGYYSEYGGTAMQTANFTTVHFLRGRQITDANGLVTFTSIFPGWYSGRATHIHVHIYKPDGTSLLVTQIAFPEGTTSAVVLVNASTANGYTKGMTGYTYNSSDNVFSDGVTSELSSVAGSVANGYVLNHTIFVSGPTLAINELDYNKNQIGQNFPNPVIDVTSIPIMLNADAKVKIELYDLSGRLISTPINESYSMGLNTIVIDKNKAKLSSGYYIYKVYITTENGIYTENKKMLVK
ncbi:T9SS type A sorting domain-containing protein [Flavobacterium sp.]|uniref:dioxygenase family protein n=1 Tax=Flavobacterium sp. TaxID=239 RepID=UPI003752E991